MYVLLFALLSALGYGSLFFRQSPVMLILGIISFSVLMVMMTDSGNNTEGMVVIGMNFDSNITGTEQGTSTNVDKTGSDELVLLKLEGVEYTVWIWLHLFLIIINSVFLFSYLMQEVS